MEAEKKIVGGWWMWILFLLVITMIVMSVGKYIGIFGTTVVERKVFENSYQKKAADEDALATFSAEVSILQAKLNNPDLSAADRAEIQAKIDAIRILAASKKN